MTKISTRRPDGTLFGQNSAPVGFSVDLSEPLVCVFRGASRPCARFARDENVEIFSQCRINTFLFFFSRLSEGASSDSRSLNGEFLRKAIVNCSSVNLWFFSSIPNCFETALKTFWKLSNNFQTRFQVIFQQNVQRHVQNKFKEMYKDIFNRKTIQRIFQRGSKRFELFLSKVQTCWTFAKLQTC